MATVTTASIITTIRGIVKDIQKTDGRDAFEYGTDTTFKLSKSYISSSGMKVYKNGTELTTGWSYNSTTNRVTITASLTSGDDIIITYSYYEKFSDTELTSYIKANLAWFTRRRYKKHFYMNSNDEVVTLDGINPTEEEGNIIAIITAIDIDPKNFRIRTPDFTIEAEETKSKSEQINEVFDQFLRNFGKIDFLEIE